MDKFTLLFPDPHIECGSGSRRENECGSMRIRIHSPGVGVGVGVGAGVCLELEPEISKMGGSGNPELKDRTVNTAVSLSF